MSRQKSDDPKRLPSIPLPQWWLDAVNRQRGEDSLESIAESLNRLARPLKLFTRHTVSDFLDGKHTPREMMHAFLLLFPELPAPVFWAESYEEADQVRRLTDKLRKPGPKHPKTADTNEGKKLPPVPDVSARRAK